jgi:hypothetical protein
MRLNSVSIQPFTSIDVYFKRLLEGEKSTSNNNEIQRLQMQLYHQYVVTGTGLYPHTSYINNSCCYYNARISTKYLDYQHDIVAIRDIEEGEEILISYLGVNPHLVQTDEEREATHQELKKRYFFECSCNEQ